MTTFKSPGNRYSLLLRKADAAQRTEQYAELTALTAELNEGNPLAALPRAEFEALLDTVLLCQNYVHGSVKTATGILIQDGLAVLRGQMTLDKFKSRPHVIFAWHELAALKLEPLVACCYMRLVHELLETPLPSQGTLDI